MASSSETTVITVPAHEVLVGDGYKGLSGRAKPQPVHGVHRTERYVYLHLPRKTLQCGLNSEIAVERKIGCDHDFQGHPESEDFGVCSKCGADQGGS